MIRLEVEPYCQECQDFEADVERPECDLLFGVDYDGKTLTYLQYSDTIIRCKYRNRCRRLSQYLERQKGENDGTLKTF